MNLQCHSEYCEALSSLCDLVYIELCLLFLGLKSSRIGSQWFIGIDIPINLLETKLSWFSSRSDIANPWENIQIMYWPYINLSYRHPNYDMVDLTIQEQDIIWSQGRRPPDMLLYLGSEGKSNVKYHLPWISDHRLHIRETTSISVNSLLSSLFYIGSTSDRRLRQ